jgi:hypothetical protein
MQASPNVVFTTQVNLSAGGIFPLYVVLDPSRFHWWDLETGPLSSLAPGGLNVQQAYISRVSAYSDQSGVNYHFVVVKNPGTSPFAGTLKCAEM